MYKILKDEDKFNEFVSFLPDLETNEVYYLCLFARHKYSPNTQDKQLVRFTSNKENLREKVLRLECNEDGYKVPQEALALYISLNPRNIAKANKNLLIELATSLAEGNIEFNPLSFAMTAIHKAIGNKHLVDFDYDGIQLAEHIDKINKLVVDYKILVTRGGFHLLVKTNGNHPNKNWFRELSKLEGCDIKGSNTIIPFAGCVQGGFVPYFA